MPRLSHSFVSLAILLASVSAGPVSRRDDHMAVQSGEATFYNTGMTAWCVDVPSHPNRAHQFSAAV